MRSKLNRVARSLPQRKIAKLVLHHSIILSRVRWIEQREGLRRQVLGVVFESGGETVRQFLYKAGGTI